MSLPLLHSPADVLRWLLIGLGQGMDPAQPGAWPVFTSGEPSTPDEVVTVYDTTPVRDVRDMVTGQEFFHHGVQVRVRGRDHPTAHAKVRALQVALTEQVYQALVSISANQYRVQCVSSTSLLSLGKDTPATKRTVFTLNCMMTVERLT